MTYTSLIVFATEGEFGKILPAIQRALVSMDSVMSIPEIPNAIIYTKEAETPQKSLLELNFILRTIASDAGLSIYKYMMMVQGERPSFVTMNV